MSVWLHRERVRGVSASLARYLVSTAAEHELLSDATVWQASLFQAARYSLQLCNDCRWVEKRSYRKVRRLSDKIVWLRCKGATVPRMCLGRSDLGGSAGATVGQFVVVPLSLLRFRCRGKF